MTIQACGCVACQAQPALAGDFARYPLEEQVFGGEFKQSLVTKRADFLARTSGARTFPWRVLMVSPDAAGLLGNDLVYRLASPLELQDVSWIRPGQSTEEWITSRLLHGVDFKSGLNTATYRYYIDFAAEYGVEYMMFDAGWSDPGDNTKMNPDIDVPGLIAYANSKGVSVLLWNEVHALSRNLEEALDRYAAWGARGIMADFMDRDDQPMLRFQERLAREAAKRRLVVNLHGVAKPTGLQRAYPNLLTREAVLGHEYNMWSERVTPDHALTVPFVRMLAGPMDWEGGAMLNGTQKTFRVVGDQPMSQGTRTQQLAQYVIYDSPLQYLAGTPSDYRAAPEFTRFLGGIPTTWDETRPLQGAIGDYVVVARRKGDTWYVAAMTDWTARKIEVPLSFLAPGEYSATVVADGMNADRYAADYKIESRTVGPRDSLVIELAPGGGYVARLTQATAITIVHSPREPVGGQLATDLHALQTNAWHHSTRRRSPSVCQFEDLSIEVSLLEFVRSSSLEIVADLALAESACPIYAPRVQSGSARCCPRAADPRRSPDASCSMTLTAC